MCQTYGRYNILLSAGVQILPTWFKNVLPSLETKVGKRMKRKKNERGKEGRVKLLQNQVRSCNVIQVLELSVKVQFW